MAKLNIILLMISCVLTPSLARRVPRDIDPHDSLPNSEIVESVFGERCYEESTEVFRILRSICPTIGPRTPQQTYTEQMNLVVMNEKFTDFMQNWTKRMNSASGKQVQDKLKAELCRFVNHPNYTLDVEPSQILSYEQYCQAVHLLDEAPEETSISSDLEKSTRQICRVWCSVEKIATVSRGNNNCELTEAQVAKLKYMFELGNCSHILECPFPGYVSRICNFLNETVSHLDQAEKLGITVELYEKLVAVRKLYAEKSDRGRLAQAKRSCEAIDGIESDGVNLLAWRKGLFLEDEKMKQFNDLWLEYYLAENSEKIASLMDVCRFIRDEKPSHNYFGPRW